MLKVYGDVRVEVNNGVEFICLKDIAGVVGCVSQTLRKRLQSKGVNIVKITNSTGLPVDYVKANELPRRMQFAKREHNEGYNKFIKFMAHANEGATNESSNRKIKASEVILTELELVKAELTELKALFKEVFNRE